MPLDAEPTELGNVVFIDDSDRVAVLGKAKADEKRAEGAILFMPHHVTCPKRAEFKRSKREPDPAATGD
jgi:hypothetical protein